MLDDQTVHNTVHEIWDEDKSIHIHFTELTSNNSLSTRLIICDKSLEAW